MNLADFLISWRTNSGFDSATKFFNHLGGEGDLGISLRHYQQIESGQRTPSFKLFALLFGRMDDGLKRDALLAMFRTTFDLYEQGDYNEGQQVIRFLEQNLLSIRPKKSTGLWQLKGNTSIYSDRQLKYLTENEEAFLLFKKVLLFGEVDRFEVDDESLVKNLQTLELIQVTNKKIKRFGRVYRIPSVINSRPRSVAKGTDFIMRHMSSYVSREGTDNQALCSAMQLVPSWAADQVLDRLNQFKDWVQSLAATRVDEECVPFVFVGFAKKLERREM
ncbi:MAG: hypothetical protein H6624_19585 [Bdellovibrionaceae bacterium]|nr:hypothetical protein [Bdellovibrionales bacterium]MCB9086552.1 hypothetical protein [Pseudobdellovibrionaceae bacterium]